MEAFMNEYRHLVIKLEDIKLATNNFDEDQVIGVGGFGKVYRGELTHSNGRSMVAIKRLDGRYGQGNTEFWKEILMLSRVTHENLISLTGFCDADNEKILVYEYASNGSLDKHLNSPDLTWTRRIQICIDAAKGLRYLHDHNGGHQRILHRDVKSSNILLDENWNAKVSDMGLSRIVPANQQYTFLVTGVVGTIGYLDPQYLNRGILTKESDVYSFGVVLFEVLCGRLCYENRNGSLVRMWRQCYKHNKLDEIVFHNRIMQQMDLKSLETFSEIAFQCLKKSCEDRPTMARIVETLDIALQFQVNLPNEYAEVLRAAVPGVFYRSLEELKVLLSNGVLLNEGKKWFSLNENEKNCEMISAAECLIPDRVGNYKYLNTSKYNSRFALPCYESYWGKFKIQARAEFLSPLVTYTVNLVFKFMRSDKTFSKLRYIGLKYNLEGETNSSIAYFADERQDGWVMLELYQFTSDGRTVDLKIQFQGCRFYYPSTIIEGVEFRPLENVQLGVLEDENVDMQPVSDSDLDWEQKLPNDFEEITKWSKDGVHWSESKELYSLLCKGFEIKEGGEWFYMAKNGKKCYILPAREALVNTQWSWQSLPELRFKQEAYDPTKCFSIECKIKSRILSPQETYACFLIYKVPEDQSEFEAPLKMRDKDFSKEDWRAAKYWLRDSPNKGWEETDYEFVFLVSPSPTPFIWLTDDQTPHNPLNRKRYKNLPQLRDDGWMEVEVWEFQTGTSTESILMRVDFMSSINICLRGLIVQGIEFKPI